MRKLLSERHFKAGYVLRKELVSGDEVGGGPPFELISAWTPTGCYIGNSKDAYRLCVQRGIAPQLSQSEHGVCSIGFSERFQKWFGWSHRAIFGFGIGSIVKEGDCCASSGWTEDYLKEHPEADKSLPVGFTAKTLEDAKRMAVAFAESVS